MEDAIRVRRAIPPSVPRPSLAPCAATEALTSRAPPLPA